MLFRSSLVLFSLVLLLSPQQESAAKDRFENCRKYEDDIRSSVRRYWGKYQRPNAWTAQLYQESLCDPFAVSPVGASGIAQFMPGTWKEVAPKIGFNGSPFDRRSIFAGAFYMSQLRSGWTSKRSEDERHRLAQASYNAGFGNIVRAQKLCNGALLWREINPCLVRVTGRHHKETITYVSRIDRWTDELDSEEIRFRYRLVRSDKECE